MTDSVTAITNSTFGFNYASFEGGAIYATGSYVNITMSTLTDNKAGYRGGAISIHRGKLVVQDTSIVNNSASRGRGDDILACNSEVDLSKSTQFSVRKDPSDSECFLYNRKAVSRGSWRPLLWSRIRPSSLKVDHDKL